MIMFAIVYVCLVAFSIFLECRFCTRTMCISWVLRVIDVLFTVALLTQFVYISYNITDVQLRASLGNAVKVCEQPEEYVVYLQQKLQCTEDTSVIPRCVKEWIITDCLVSVYSTIPAEVNEFIAPPLTDNMYISYLNTYKNSFIQKRQIAGRTCFRWLLVLTAYVLFSAADILCRLYIVILSIQEIWRKYEHKRQRCKNFR